MEILKVELGCGKTKSEGYLGVDRFPLEGVDIVADLNQELPFEDNSVDTILACHSLEHVNDLYFTMSEIFRICKHGAIMYILAPYYNTSLNIANLYHKSVFNEDTFRFFSRSRDSNLDYEDYYCPSAITWGLSQSDNSFNKIEVSVLNMEYFYYKEYYYLTEQERRRARRALSNVCDQVYYIIAVNKGEKPLTDEELTLLTKEANEKEPARINSLRNRKPEINDADSIYKDIAKISLLPFEKKLTEVEGKLAESDKKIETLNSKVASQMMVAEQHNLLLKEQIKTLQEEKNTLSAVTLDLLKQNENKRSERFNFFIKRNSLFSEISIQHPQFVHNMTLHCAFDDERSALSLSPVVSFAQCTTYQLEMNGDTIHYFLIACTGAKLLTEVVQNNTILKQEVVTVTHEGEHTLLVKGRRGRVDLRFRTMDPYSIVRILEVHSRKNLFFTKSSLAYFTK